MKRLSYTFICLLFISCYSISRNCSDYKTGKFEFKYTIDGLEKTGQFVRTLKYNIDYYDGEHLHYHLHRQFDMML